MLISLYQYICLAVFACSFFNVCTLTASYVYPQPMELDPFVDTKKPAGAFAGYPWASQVQINLVASTCGLAPETTFAGKEVTQITDDQRVLPTVDLLTVNSLVQRNQMSIADKIARIRASFINKLTTRDTACCPEPNCPSIQHSQPAKLISHLAGHLRRDETIHAQMLLCPIVANYLRTTYALTDCFNRQAGMMYCVLTGACFTDTAKDKQYEHMLKIAAEITRELERRGGVCGQ